MENISKRLRHEEMNHNKMKEAIIAERQKLKTYALTIYIYNYLLVQSLFIPFDVSQSRRKYITGKN